MAIYKKVNIKKKLAIGIGVAVAVVMVAMLAGCVEKEDVPVATSTPTATPTPEITESPLPTSTHTPTPTPTPIPSRSPSSEPTPSPTLKPIERAKISTISDAKPVDDEGYPALKVSIWGTKFTGDFNVTVKSEDGEILDTVIISPEKEHGWIRTNLKIGDYHETLAHSSYAFTVIVSDAQGVLSDNTFSGFDGAKVTGCSYVAKEGEWLVIANGDELMKRYFISSVTCNFRSCGDFPAYIDHATLGGISIDCPELLRRDETKSYLTPLSGFDLDIGDITVYDKNGNIV